MGVGCDIKPCTYIVGDSVLCWSDPNASLCLSPNKGAGGYSLYVYKNSMGVVYGFSRIKVAQIDRKGTFYGITTHRRKSIKVASGVWILRSIAIEKKRNDSVRAMGTRLHDKILTMGVVYLGGSQRLRTISRTPGKDYAHVEISDGIPHVFNGLPWVCGQFYGNSLSVGVKTFAPYPHGWSVQRYAYRGRLCEKCILRDRAEVGK